MELERPQLIAEMADAVGRQSVVVTFDVRKGGLLGGHTIYTHNAKRKRPEKIANAVAQAADQGAGEILINSIDRDGMMQGYDLALAKTVRDATSTPMTILGGAGGTGDMTALIDTVGTVGAAAGSFFVFNGPYRAVLISYAKP